MKKILSILVLAIFAFSAIAYGATKVQDFIVNDELSIKEENSEETPEEKNTINVLLAGVDSAVNLTDVIIIASYETEKNTLAILQIPRDTYVGETSKTGKINSIYNKYTDSTEGINALKATLEDALPIEIDYTAIINLSGFRAIVDALGGVSVDIPYTIDYLPGMVLYPGVQVLSGEQAEWLIRYREGYATGDIGRLQMQRYFMAALVDTIKAKSTSDLVSLIPIAMDYVDTDMPMSIISEFAPSAINMTMESIYISELAGDGVMYMGQAIYQVNKEKTAEIFNEIFSGEETFTAEDINTIEVIEVGG